MRLKVLAFVKRANDTRDLFEQFTVRKNDTRRDLFEQFTVRKPSDLDDLYEIEWLMLADEHHTALASKPEVRLDITNFFTPVVPMDHKGCDNIEYVDSTTCRGSNLVGVKNYLIYVNTEGAKYARYSFKVKMSPNNWIEFDKLRVDAKNRMVRKMKEINLREKRLLEVGNEDED